MFFFNYEYMSCGYYNSRETLVTSRQKLYYGKLNYNINNFGNKFTVSFI